MRFAVVYLFNQQTFLSVTTHSEYEIYSYANTRLLTHNHIHGLNEQEQQPGEQEKEKRNEMK